MDFDEIFEMFDIEPEGEDEAQKPPDFRATIRGSQLMVVGWMPHLMTSGPVGVELHEPSEAIVKCA